MTNGVPPMQDPASDGDALLTAFLTNWGAASGAWASSLGGRTLQTDDAIASFAGRPAFVSNAVTPLVPISAPRLDPLMRVLNGLYSFESGTRTGRVLIFSAWPVTGLESYGWSVLGNAPLMMRPAGGTVPVLSAGIRMAAVQNEVSLRDAEIVTVRGFGIKDPECAEPGGLFGPALLNDDRVRMWVAYEGGTPVSTAASFVAEGITNVINVATIPEARGRGYGTAVTWEATLTEPHFPTLLIASAHGRPVYERMGYTAIREFQLWSRQSGEEKPQQV
jgi:hypothetical protein